MPCIFHQLLNGTLESDKERLRKKQITGYEELESGYNLWPKWSANTVSTVLN